MALSISLDNSIITLCISGCHNGNCNKESNGCGDIQIFTESFHPYISTPLTRLFLHIQFGREYKIDEFIKKFDEYFKDGNNINENGVEYFKKIILEDLETDSTWKICPVCSIEYNNGIRQFEKINFIVPEKDLCIFHNK